MNAEEWLKSHHKKYAHVFEKCDKLASATESFLGSLSLSFAGPKNVLITTLFMRLLQLYEGAIWLAQFGMNPAGRAVVRAELETAFILVALTKDDRLMTQYIAQDDLQRLKLIEAIERNRSPVFAQLESLSMGGKKQELQKRVKEEKIRRIATEEFARVAGMQDWYDTAYRLLSGAVHSRIRDVGQGVKVDMDGELRKFRCHPSDEDTYLILTTASNLVLFTAEILVDAIGQGDIEKVLHFKPFFLELSRSAVNRWNVKDNC